MDQCLRPARLVAPGRILVRELEARGWTQKDLAAIMGRPPQVITEIVQGTKQITPATALELSGAFGTSPEFWLNLETNYRLHRVEAERARGAEDIKRRSRLYELAPIRELTRRGWLDIDDSAPLDTLEAAVCSFLGIASPRETPALAVSFRQSAAREPDVRAQVAWVRRVEHLARQQLAAPFDPASLDAILPELQSCAARVDEVREVPRLLQRAGVRFVLVPHLPKTYLDGAALRLDSRDDQPVVAMTLRYDRIDAFWFTLLHELAHIAAGHQGIYLDDLDHCDGSGEEAEANAWASTRLIERAAFDKFIQSASPDIPRLQIELFARQQGRHPGIVLGQLQHKGLVAYNRFRALLEKVSPYLKDRIDVAAPRMVM